MRAFRPRRARSGAPLLIATVLTTALTCAALAGCTSTPTSTPATTLSATPTTSAAEIVDSAAFARLETQFRAQVGVYALDTGTGRSVAYRADTRFAFDSTYKALIAGVLLRTRTDQQLATVISYTAAELQKYSPITSQHVATGMSVRDLMIAALDYSDNTAANLLLDQLGGPGGLQRALRGLGDATTNSDRTEPTVNTATPGDPRDTSTPRALGTDLREFVLGSLLTPARRQMLTDWLVANTTGGPYIRAGVPAGWKVGDKTGNGDYGSRNDIAIAWPPSGAPIVIAILSNRGNDQNAPSADALIADATKAALAALS